MTWPLLIGLAFLSGSIPFGLLIARARGVDIRKHGSGNIGATNVARVLGPRLGLVCFALDVLKGLAPVLAAGLTQDLLHRTFNGAIASDQAWSWLAVVAAAILGHMFSPWIGFRGGKGVATGLGALLGLWPYLTIPALGALVLWIIVVALTRYISLGSCLAAASLPLWCFLAGTRNHSAAPFVIFTSIMAALIILKHRANIRRLLSGTENRLGARANPQDVHAR